MTCAALEKTFSWFYTGISKSNYNIWFLFNGLNKDEEIYIWKKDVFNCNFYSKIVIIGLIDILETYFTAT